MRLRIVFISLFLFLVSCGEKVIKEPENLIGEEKMSMILCDIAIFTSAKGAYPKILEENSIEQMPFIFEKYKIDSTQFVQSDLYYASIPLKYQSIYEAVEACLEKEIKLFNDAKKRKSDSINNAEKRKSDSLKPPTKIRDSLLKK